MVDACAHEGGAHAAAVPGSIGVDPLNFGGLIADDAGPSPPNRSIAYPIAQASRSSAIQTTRAGSSISSRCFSAENVCARCMRRLSGSFAAPNVCTKSRASSSASMGASATVARRSLGALVSD